MIDAKNLVLSSSTLLDTSTAGNSQSTSVDQLANIILGQNVDSQAAEDSLVDSNTFISLLSQVLADVSGEADKASAELTGSPVLTEELLTDTDPSAQLLAENALINTNLATTWIDSESFQALSAASPEALLTAQANVQSVAVNPNIPAALAILNPEGAANLEVASKEDLAADLEMPLEDAAANEETFASANSLQVGKDVHSSKFREDLAIMSNASLNTSTKLETAPSQQMDPSALQNIQATQPKNSQAENAPKSLEITVPVSSPQWSEKFSEHIAWLGNHGVKGALIKLHPEELGPLEINIKVAKDAATVNILSHSGLVRDVVEQAIPKLRDMMEAQGLNLAEVHIGTQADPRQSSQREQTEQESSLQFEEEAQITPLNNKNKPKGLIDYFA